MFVVQDASHTADLSAVSRPLSLAAGLPVQLVTVIESTNQALLDSAPELPLHPQSPCALMALAQSAGRGRRGRSWSVTHSTEPNTAKHPAFLGSLGLRCTLPLQALGLLPLHVGLAVVQQLNQWGCTAQLKWPNDLVIATAQGSAKLGGILVETRSLSDGEHAVVIGMGLNWHSAPVLVDKRTACVVDGLKAAGASVPTALDASASLLIAMAAAWQRCIDHPTDFAQQFAAVDALYGQEITAVDAADEAQLGVAKGINAQGHLGLLLNSTGQLVWLHSGEVSVRLKA
jgi:BirA family biotin operon repressor/biotin-[acetyl-CoA-carboxylase] ligase